MKPLQVFVPLTRRDAEARVLEGYCYVNARVRGDLYDLSRAAMEAATPDYAAYGNIREMHGKNAIGLAKGTAVVDGDELPLGVQWDEKGALLRCKIVDDDAWRKVEEGVYQGFSVGFKPEVLRGRTVVQGRWIETSLVDRPADPDCDVMAVRVDELGESHEVCIQDPEQHNDEDAEEQHIAALQSEIDRLKAQLAQMHKVKRSGPRPVLFHPEQASGGVERTFLACESQMGDDKRQELAALERLSLDPTRLAGLTAKEREANARRMVFLRMALGQS